MYSPVKVTATLVYKLHDHDRLYKRWTQAPGLKSKSNAEVPEMFIHSNSQQGATPLVTKRSMTEKSMGKIPWSVTS